MIILIVALLYLAAFFYVKTTMFLKKREQIDGVSWLDTWTIRDLQYSEEMLWGIKSVKLLDYKLGSQTKSLIEYVQEAEKLLKVHQDTLDKIEEQKKSKKRYKKLVIESQQITAKDREIFELAKTKGPEDLRGEYYYIVELSQKTTFADTEEHTFENALFVTHFPFWIEFNPVQLEVEVDGYYAKARAAKCALNVESWLTDNRPLVTVAWTEASTLDIKAKLEKSQDINQEKEDRTRRVIEGLRDLVDHFESTGERVTLAEKKWERRADEYQDLYEESEMEWEEKHDNYFNQNARDRKQLVSMKKSWALAFVVIFIVLCSVVFGTIFRGG